MRLYALIFTLASIVGCSSNDDDSPAESVDVLPSIFTAANMAEAEPYFNTLVQSFNVGIDGSFVREPVTKTSTMTEPPEPLIEGVAVVGFGPQPMQAPDAKIVDVACSSGGSFVFTGEPTSVSVDGGSYVIDDCVIGSTIFNGEYAISARVDGLTQTSYTFDGLSVSNTQDGSVAVLDGRLVRTSRASPLLDEVEWVDANVTITGNNSTAEYRNVNYKHAVVGPNPDWSFESNMSVTAPWTNGEPVSISTTAPFTVSDASIFTGIYGAGILSVNFGTEREISIDANTGDLATFSFTDDNSGSVTSDLVDWSAGSFLRCANTVGLSLADADNCERAMEGFGDFLD